MRVALLPGDGIGPEVASEAIKVLSALKGFGMCFDFTELPVGGAAIDACGHPLPPETITECAGAEAILFGAVGGAKWDCLPSHLRPEQGILGLRKRFGLFANLRPVTLWPGLESKTPLKPEIAKTRPDILVVRELTGGLYFGQHRRVPSARAGGERSTDTMVYTTKEVTRIARVAFSAAAKRRRCLTSVDKANVLATSRMWRDVVDALSAEYPGVAVHHMYVDNCAMQMVLNPSHFDVLLTENTFGDILSDLGGALVGSLGMVPSASLGLSKFGLYEPSHGSAPDIAGLGKANPLAMILSAAMMLRYSFDLEEAACRVESAVGMVLQQGFRTQDIFEAGNTLVSCAEMGDRVASLVASH